jgi:hypothetical protein
MISVGRVFVEVVLVIMPLGARTAMYLRALVFAALFASNTLVLIALTGCSDGNDFSDSVDNSREQRRAEADHRFEVYFKAKEAYAERLPDEAYNQLVKKIALQNEYAVEFCELYPQAFQQSSRMFAHIGPMPEVTSNGILWDFMAFVAPLYGRYEFRCFIPFSLSADYTTVEAFGDPSFDLIQVFDFEQTSVGGYKVNSRRVVFPGDLHRYELEDWQRFKKHNGDWAKIGVHLRMDEPWPGFDEYCRRNMLR